MKNHFYNKEKPTMNELVNWMQVKYPKLCDDMKNCKHSYKTDEPNPYHLEDNIWAHTMMVCQRAEIECEKEYNKILLMTALLHDIGKVEAREVIDFDTKKYKDNIPKSGKKVRFIGHEGLSFYKAIEILNELEKIEVINEREKKVILSIISMHGTLFNNIDEDGNMKKPEKVFEKFTYFGYFNTFILQVKCDSLGRFYNTEKGRKNSAYKLGTEIYTEEQFKEYRTKNIHKLRFIDNRDKEINLLVGVPGSGKSTFLKENKKDSVIISRDDILMEYGKDKGSNYSEIWNNLTNEDQKNIDKLLNEKFNKAVKENKNIIIDMTNTSKKSRRKWLANVPKNYNKKATMFATSYNEVFRRLEKRRLETGKSIPEFVIKNMMKGFMIPGFDEVDEINWIF